MTILIAEDFEQAATFLGVLAFFMLFIEFGYYRMVSLVSSFRMACDSSSMFGVGTFSEFLDSPVWLPPGTRF